MHVLEMISDFVFAPELSFADGAGVWCGLAVHAVHVAEHVASALESYVAAAEFAF
jgi:hypothetical protein